MVTANRVIGLLEDRTPLSVAKQIETDGGHWKRD